MKKILFSAFLLGLVTFSQAQTTDSTGSNPPVIGGRGRGGRQPGTPTERAARQLTVLQKRLNLSQEQVQQVRMILIDRAAAIDSLQQHPSGQRRADNQARKAVADQIDQRINDLLTDDQKKLYQQWKDEQRAQRRGGRGKFQQTPGSEPAAQ